VFEELGAQQKSFDFVREREKEEEGSKNYLHLNTTGVGQT
jgi:hypothetical protein